MWLDDCRIPFVDETEKEGVCKSDKTIKTYNEDWGNTIYNYKRTGGDIKGRFTPNLLVCDDMLNDGIKPNKGHRSKSKVTGYGEFGGGKSEYHGVGEYMEVDSKSRYYDLDLWFDKLIKELN